MEKQKEVWIRFPDTKAYIENANKLSGILDKLPGKCEVIVYIKDSRNIRTIQGRTFDENRLSLLAEAFGAENVKFREKGQWWDKPEAPPEIKQIIPCNSEMYAVMAGSDGMRWKCKVLMYALCSDGEVHPLHFDNLLGVSQIGEVIQNVESYVMEGGTVIGHAAEGRIHEYRESK